MELLPWGVYAFYIALTSVIVFAVLTLAVSRREKVPGRFQAAFEAVMEPLRNVFLSALGPGGEPHLPLVFTLFWYILFCNMIELVPFFRAATANPSNTIGLGIIVFCYVQYVGIKSKGLVEYAKHFLGPLLILAPLFILIEVMGEFIKPFSLGMRLFGNIYAEDVMNDLAANAVHIGPINLPLQIIVYPLQIFTGLIQAFIFPMLTCAYISIMSDTHEHSGDQHEGLTHQGEEKALDRAGDFSGAA